MFTLPPLYPILDERYMPSDADARSRFLRDTVRELAEAGVALLQLRMKTASLEELLHAASVVREAAPSSMRLILNDRAECLDQTGFDGVHLGQQDMALDVARAWIGPRALLGLSTHTPRQARAGSATSADYLATGPVFVTASKADAEPAIGLDGVRAARAATAKPLVAIGGITLANVEAVWAAGADSVAVIGSLFAGGRAPGRIAEDFLRLFR